MEDDSPGSHTHSRYTRTVKESVRSFIIIDGDCSLTGLNRETTPIV